LIGSAVMFAGIYPAMRNSTLGSAAIFSSHCGKLECSAQGIFPLEAPDKIRNFIIAGPVAVCYLPENAAALPENFQQDCPVGVLWSGSQLGLWHRTGQSGFVFFGINKSMTSAVAQNVADRNELFKKFRASDKLQLNLPPGKKQIITPEQLKNLLEVLLPLWLGGWFLKQTLLEVLLYIAMFTGVFALMNIGRPKRFKVKEMAVMAIYAGFPVMIIGSVAEALGLFDFNIIYVLGMTFYLIYIMNRLTRDSQEQAWRQGDQP